MLIDQNRVTVRINHHKTGRTVRTFIRFRNQLNAKTFELALQFPNVREIPERLRIAVPSRIEGEDVLFEHALKQPDGGFSIPYNQPVLRLTPGKYRKTQLLVKAFRRLNILHLQTDRKAPSSISASNFDWLPYNDRLIVYTAFAGVCRMHH